MGRRNRDIGIIYALGAAIVLPIAMMVAALRIPTLRPALLQILPFLLTIFIIAIGVGAFLVFHTIRQRRLEADYSDSPDAWAGGQMPPVIDQIRGIDWFQFEKILEITYGKLGYTVTRRGVTRPDGGVDLIIEKDGQRQAVQCKHWKTWNIGVKTVREFLGALTDGGISTGIFVVLGGCTADAKALADKHGIQILDEADLARMLESVDAQNDPEILALLKDKRKFCPKCEREMILRTAKGGPNPGSRFWGCSGYPACRFVLPV